MSCPTTGARRESLHRTRAAPLAFSGPRGRLISSIPPLCRGHRSHMPGRFGARGCKRHHSLRDCCSELGAQECKRPLNVTGVPMRPRLQPWRSSYRTNQNLAACSKVVLLANVVAQVYRLSLPRLSLSLSLSLSLLLSFPLSLPPCLCLLSYFPLSRRDCPTFMPPSPPSNAPPTVPKPGKIASPSSAPPPAPRKVLTPPPRLLVLVSW